MRSYLSFKIIIILSILTTSQVSAEHMLVYMDKSQKDHLKAYGLAFQALEQDLKVEWLLNYRGGSFVLPANKELVRAARLCGVSFTSIGAVKLHRIHTEVTAGNMERVVLNKAPKIAVYTPPDVHPWADAVTQALEYAGVPYVKLWDEAVLEGKLADYDWLHLHHEDFTGQYNKLNSYSNAQWYQKTKDRAEKMATKFGFSSVSEEKKAVARAIKAYVQQGGFLFAMCSATETLEIALSAGATDIVDPIYDGTPMDPDYQAKLDYSKTLAFENFTLEPNPYINSFSNIDVNQVNRANLQTGPFTLFEFSAKFDPVPSMLIQNHVKHIPGFYGLSTTFNRQLIKRSVTILAEEVGTKRARYIHGHYGQGTFSFYGGHDPEDKKHLLGEVPTNLQLHKNSPGYRLILNNFFTAAQKRKQKT